MAATDLTPVQPPKQKSWLARGVMAIGAFAALVFLLPVIYFAFLSALGLLGIGIIAVIGIGLIQLLPLLGQKWENKILGLRKAEARANPIEQLQNSLVLKAQKLQSFKEGMLNIGSQIASLDDSLKAQALKDPEDDFTDQRAAIAKMKEFYERRKVTYGAAVQALEDYKKAIDRAKFKYGFGTAAQGIAQAMNDNDAQTLMSNMLADEAFKSVDQRFNSAFAALDLDSAELSNTNRIEFGKGLAIDLQTIKIPNLAEQPVMVGRK